MAEIERVGVLGAGLMGHGIAYLLAAVGHRIGVFEPIAEIRASIPQRLRAIIDLLGDDAALSGAAAPGAGMAVSLIAPGAATAALKRPKKSSAILRAWRTSGSSGTYGRFFPVLRRSPSSAERE